MSTAPLTGNSSAPGPLCKRSRISIKVHLDYSQPSGEHFKSSVSETSTVMDLWTLPITSYESVCALKFCWCVSHDLYLLAVTEHSFSCLREKCMQYVLNCLGLWGAFFSMVGSVSSISTNDFNLVISMWFGVTIRDRVLQIYIATTQYCV